MIKPINELVNTPKDPNSPESQEFLRELQKNIEEHRAKMKEIYQSWVDEDQRNENR